MSRFEQVDASLRTDRGQVRDHNEDYIAFWEPSGVAEEKRHGWLYIVADGVGGAEAGEVASRYASERTIHHYLANGDERDWAARLEQAMRAANRELRQMVAEQNGSYRMATTMVAALLYGGGRVVLANVGDSRGYFLRNGVLEQITKDQSLVAHLLEEGAITAEEAVNHPRRNVILHSLGAENSPRIDLFNLTLEADSALLLCSDGLTRHVSDEEIAAIAEELPPSAATARLIELANERGGEDNISVAILRFVPAKSAGAATVKITPSVYKDMGGEGLKLDVTRRRILWLYTAFLGLVQTILIVFIWYILRI